VSYIGDVNPAGLTKGVSGRGLAVVCSGREVGRASSRGSGSVVGASAGASTDTDTDGGGVARASGHGSGARSGERNTAGLIVEGAGSAVVGSAGVLETYSQ
jgi:hypothetical protein